MLLRLLLFVAASSLFAIHLPGQGACIRPTITTAPALRYEIHRGDSVTLSVKAEGTDLHYRWWYYSTITSREVDVGWESSVTVTPAHAYPYYVRVYNVCGRVEAPTYVCHLPRALSPPTAEGSIADGIWTLRIAIEDFYWGDPVSAQWFEGPPGDMQHPLTAPNDCYFNPFCDMLVVHTRRPTQYWARLTNHCGTYESEAIWLTGVESTPALSAKALAMLAAVLAGAALFALNRA